MSTYISQSEAPLLDKLQHIPEDLYQLLKQKLALNTIESSVACSLLALLTPRPLWPYGLSWWKITAKLRIWIATSMTMNGPGILRSHSWRENHSLKVHFYGLTTSCRGTFNFSAYLQAYHTPHARTKRICLLSMKDNKTYSADVDHIKDFWKAYDEKTRRWLQIWDCGGTSSKIILNLYKPSF